MKTRAALAFAAGKPLEIVEVDLEGPRAGEVLVEIKATGVCHTDTAARPRIPDALVSVHRRGVAVHMQQFATAACSRIQDFGGKCA